MADRGATLKRGLIVAALLTAGGCVLFRPWAPQPSAPPRECVGTFQYPDSAGVCIPKTPNDMED